MKQTSKNILSTLLITSLSSAASAMSLGDGQIFSRVGEPFSANIAFVGAYDKEVKFHQVKSAECRSSMIGKSAAGCDYIYEGSLNFFIKKTPDDQYYLKVVGEKSEDLFYRIIIKYESPSSGQVYKAFEFLPEFRSNAAPLPASRNDTDATVNSSMPSGKYGVIMGNVVEALPEEDVKRVAHSPAKKPAEQNESLPANADAIKPANEAKPKRNVSVAPPPPPQKKPQTDKPVEPKLQIQKGGTHADDIYALQKENEVIEQQISLLEKQIALLKEVASLKSQTGESSVPATTIAPASHVPEAAPAPAPVKVPLPVTTKQSPEFGISWLNGILIAIVLILLAALWFLYRRQKGFHYHDNLDDFGSGIVSPASEHGKQSLDLTERFFIK